ncbi:hypothetical protein L1987_06361 [Smallanthus sonchifolius]|uniref:Uncharacterized protein n=1 Tax=Smallanthus sonchifolius TaxID=185202 RepID=A0ACB9JY49_9ASTR|nr:hypothetical protein L1987_06361 [Smallanthus sonchifolius]
MHAIGETKLTLPNPTTDLNSIHAMEVECMKACTRKLAIWYTPNFKPIITHDELDHIMSTLGFLPLPPVPTAAPAALWKEYSFSAAGAFLVESPSPPPRPRLPYPRIDGLHVDTYRLFLESLDFYLRMNNISDLFHIRGMPLHHAYDRHHKWLRMIGDDLVYVYREGTADLLTIDKNADNDQKPKPVLHIVPWKNIMDKIWQMKPLVEA